MHQPLDEGAEGTKGGIGGCCRGLQFFLELNPRKCLHKTKAGRREASVEEGAGCGEAGRTHIPFPSYKLSENHGPILMSNFTTEETGSSLQSQHRA